jgi:hypothetical protein
MDRLHSTAVVALLFDVEVEEEEMGESLVAAAASAAEDGGGQSSASPTLTTRFSVLGLSSVPVKTLYHEMLTVA